MFQTLFATRVARPTDAGDLTDIDTKAFEISWPADEWYELCQNSFKDDADRTVLVISYYGNVIGFAVVKTELNEATVEKIAVKEAMRRKGAGRMLFQDVVMRAEDKRYKSVALIMPESYVYPVEGLFTPALCWALACGLKPTKGFIKNHFTVYGEQEDGVKFVIPTNHETTKS